MTSVNGNKSEEIFWLGAVLTWSQSETDEARRMLCGSIALIAPKENERTELTGRVVDLLRNEALNFSHIHQAATAALTQLGVEVTPTVNHTKPLRSPRQW